MLGPFRCTPGQRGETYAHRKNHILHGNGPVPDARSDRRGFEGEGIGARKGFVFEGSDLRQGITVAENHENDGEGDKGAEGYDDRKGIEHAEDQDAEDNHDVPNKAGQGGDQVREEVQHHGDDHAYDDHNNHG
jgi:hypothetical protein